MNKVLVIDDSDLVSRLLNEFLSSHGFEVSVAADANQGYAKAIEFAPDLILLDVQLPDVTGFELCRVLKNRPELQNTPIIMITGTAHKTEEKIRGFQTGADDYVLKPFEMPELLERIRAILKRYERRRSDQEAAHPALPATGKTVAAPIEETPPPTLLQSVRGVLFHPVEWSSSGRYPAVTGPYLGALTGLFLAGLVVSAGGGLRPAPAVLSLLLLWGLIVSVVVMASSVLGITLGWNQGARLVCLAGLPLLFKMAGAFVASAWTTLPPSYFTAGPALWMGRNSPLWQRLDFFEMWSVALLWILLRRQPASSARKASLITLIAWIAALAMGIGLMTLDDVHI